LSGWDGKRVLVTGAGGFIGGHLVELLVAAGAEVRAFVQYNSRNDWGSLDHVAREVVDAIEVVAGDVRDPFGVRRAVEGVDTVFHLAALIGIPYSYVAPEAYVATNVTGTLNVLEAVRGTGARMVHTSTSETYGTATYTPIDEAHPLQGQSPYSASKIGADKMAESYHRSFGVEVATLRPFNTFGPRQSLRAVIPTIIAQALGGGPVRLGSLTPVRDFTYVRDTARAFMAVAASDAAVGRTLNSGNGKGITIGELARLALDAVGSDAEIVADEVRVRPEASEVFELLCDSTQLRELTGWQPEVTLREGLAATAEWLRAGGSAAAGKAHIYTV
jgi:NAD dependent epimerase/dehydratase